MREDVHVGAVCKRDVHRDDVRRDHGAEVQHRENMRDAKARELCVRARGV